MLDEPLLAARTHEDNVTGYPRTQREIDEIYGDFEHTTGPRPCKNTAFTCSKDKCISKVLSCIPIVHVIRTYKYRDYILGDLLSGISAACLHFPQGLAFGILASLDPVYGLYSSVFPIICYMLFGSSPHVSFGTNAVIALFTAEIVGSSHQYVEITPLSNAVNQSGFLNSTFLKHETITEDECMMLKVMTSTGASVVVGLILLTMGILRMGFITTYMSSSFVHAFVSVCALHIVTSQIPKFLGIKIPIITGAGKFMLTCVEIVKALPTVNIASCIVSSGAFLVLLVVKVCINERFKVQIKVPVPIDLIIIITVTMVSHFCKLSEQFGVQTVGVIPSGFPAPMMPSVPGDITFLYNCFIVAVLVFVLTIAMIRICEDKHSYQVDDNQELVAFGITNILCGFFHCFPSCTAPPRTMVLSDMGAKTTLNGFFTASLMCLVVLFIGPLFSSLPHPLLSAMTIVAVKDLILHIADLHLLWRTNRYDVIIWLTTMISGILIDIPFALYSGILFGFFTVILQSQKAAKYIVEKLPHENVFVDNSKYDGLEAFTGVKIFRMEASLYFATAKSFRDHLFSRIGDPRNVESCNTDEIEMSGYGNACKYKPMIETQFIILDCSSVNYVDISGMRVIGQIVKLYGHCNIPVLFASCSKSMLKSFKTSILSNVVSDMNVYASIQDAIRACVCILPQIP